MILSLTADQAAFREVSKVHIPGAIPPPIVIVRVDFPLAAQCHDAPPGAAAAAQPHLLNAPTAHPLIPLTSPPRTFPFGAPPKLTVLTAVEGLTITTFSPIPLRQRLHSTL